MKQVFLLYAIALFFIIPSCQEATSRPMPVMAPQKVLRDVMSFLRYRQQHIQFYTDFTPLDKGGRLIPKELFFRYLSTGRFVPLRLAEGNSKPAYQLHKMEPSVDDELRQIIKDWGKDEYARFKTEGQPFPYFDFTDLQGRRYTTESLRGKTLVLKAWFVNCLPCRQEMPALNALKKELENRTDVVFLSLCLDEKEAIANFLQSTRFDYPVVPDQRSFLDKKLQVAAYPTHFVVNAQGTIVKKLNDHKAMEAVLKAELGVN